MTVEGDCYVFRCSQSKQKLSTARYEYLKARYSAKRLKLQEEVENIETCKLNDNYDEDNQEVCPCGMKLVYCADSQKVLMFETSDEHEFHNAKTAGISKGMSEKIF